MEQWSVRDDSPFVRRDPPPGSGAPWLLGIVALILAVAVVGGVGYYYFSRSGPPPVAVPAPAPAPAAASTRTGPVESPAPAPGAAQPAIEHPLALPETSETLPSLDASDPTIADMLSKLYGASSFARFFYPDRIVQRFVAAIDALPREKVSERVMPVKPVPGLFEASGQGDLAIIAARNAERYRAYLRLLDKVDARTLVDVYVRLYPLFQSAYRRLGYPNGYFNDRLVEAIDDLLAAPDVKGPVKLIQPRVLYQYADSELEGLSAGQKIMVRIGAANERKVKAKLREIRAELLRRAPHS